MSKLRKYSKLILFDTLALLCFIGVVLFGWIPGPGGVPLFLLGLGLLAANHDWAERWLETAKHKGVTFKKWLFPDIKWVRCTYDILTLALMAASVYLVAMYENRFIEAGAVFLGCSGLFVFLLNRDRFGKISSLFRKS
ncbi:MAG: PGPGW domain-containing protein [Candidatus Saccharimonadales bacterium]